MRIGELATRAGVSTRTLRYYEEKGLLAPARRTSGYRTYEPGDADVVRRIRALLAAGLNTATIAEILPCLTEREGVLVPSCPELADGLRSERERIDAAIADLRAARTALDTIIDATPDEALDGACDGVPGDLVGAR